MLLSYDHRFIFIHNYRVAGTSIRKSLEKYVKRPLLRRFFEEIGVGNKLSHHKWETFPAHIKAKELRRILPADLYDTFYKFAFVRNPWDWQVSLYHYMLKNKSHRQHRLISAMESFDEYIVWRVNEGKVLQKDFVTDSEGTMIVDFVGRYENLSKDFLQVCNALNINASLPHINKSSHRNYRSYYRAETRSLVEENFSADIELFGYTF
jgi:hypothetical protein